MTILLYNTVLAMDITHIQKDFEGKLALVDSISSLEDLEVHYLGRNGVVNELLARMKQLPSENKKEAGLSINTLKRFIGESVKIRKNQILIESGQNTQIDVTLPPPEKSSGSLHPITIAVNEITAIFNKIGFIRMSYPEVDWEHYAFEVLNMPVTHAARDDFETTFLSGAPHKTMGKMVLTPHTSNGQVREMERLASVPPIRMINVGKCYRPNWDATHTPMFHQFEGLCVDKDITIAHLKGTLDFFVKAYFGENTEVRLRPHHFQFTEPSFEVDITCTMCKGTALLDDKKCNICKSGWLELGGTGMVHPNVLKAGKIDPQVYSGWAFGFGIERVNMMKYAIDDIRSYYSGDLRFLSLF